MTNPERLRMLAENDIARVFVILVEGKMVAVSRNGDGYFARLVGKPDAILARGCGSEAMAIKAAQAVLEIGPVI